MKKLVVIMLLVAATATIAHAGLKVVGKGDAMQLNSAGYPPAMKANYRIMQGKCVKCHSLERIIVALQTGVAPISGQPFDRSATRAYGTKMLRKSDFEMSKAEVKGTVDLLDYLLAEAER